MASTSHAPSTLDQSAAEYIQACRQAIAQAQAVLEAAISEAFAQASKRAKRVGSAAVAETTQALRDGMNPDADSVTRAAVGALQGALRAAVTTAERTLARQLRSTRLRVLEAARFGADNARRAAQEAEVQWRLHRGLADDGKAPAATLDDLRRGVRGPLEATAADFESAGQRLMEALRCKLDDQICRHVQAMSEMGTSAVQWIPQEVQRLSARKQDPEVARDKAIFWTLMTAASAAGIATLEREHPDLLQSLLAAGGIAATTGVVAHAANNVRLGGPPFEGASTAAWKAVPAGLMAALAGSSVAQGAWADVAARLRPLVSQLAPAHLDIVLEGIWRAGGLLMSQVLARALVVGAHSALSEVDESIATQRFDVVTFSAAIAREARHFAVGDVRQWSELEDESVGGER